MNALPLTGLIDRRILINFRADPAVVSKLLPAPFRPQLQAGSAMVGICLIRLKQERLRGLPVAFGLTSENGAHRIAVEWEVGSGLQQGVYIPRRDTSSRINCLVGNQLIGKHYHSKFWVKEQDGSYAVSFLSSDGTSLAVEAQETTIWPSTSIFASLEQASEFYQNGATGYSPNASGPGFRGVKLSTRQWQVSALSVGNVISSYFEDATLFPHDSVVFDNALLMTNTAHEWRRLSAL
ncbi:DUF2071 domain-containing protein [Hymenobacter negativus]|uniref:DUF2071 domain-containing protein n=1 Tax=Hymenobacter negativus TaxID=2795026 RepID=A0ABS0Q3J2_9BACT|nr:DUF2071 domain-containing protein [Hymenobacter negativus]MBH8557082.1 DUF2071 domain-containing protein [Hymenobacter negativus]